MTLGEAWSLWFAGQIDGNRLLWGLELFWWERIGKGLQLIAAATIVAEIIGAPALRKFGNSLHGRVAVSSLKENLTHLVDWLGLLWRHVFIVKPGSHQEKELRGQLSRYKSDWISFHLALALAIAFFFLVEISDFWLWQLLATFAVLFLLMIIICPILLVVGFALLSGFGLALDFLLIEPVAWLLERESLDRLIKLLAFVLLVVGFHFDFLAS